MEDLEEIDELFAQEQRKDLENKSLASKYAKFEALADEED